MKKNLLSVITLLAVLFTASYSQAQTKKKVAYITADREFSANAADVRNDPIIKLLQADSNFEVTIFVVAMDSVLEDLSGFDLAVVQESFYSTAEIYKPTGSAALAGFTIPFIYTKMWALKDGRALTSGGAKGGAEAAGVAITVEQSKQSNELFNGISFTNNKFDMFLTTASGTGDDGEVALNYAEGLVLSNKNTLLGTVDEITFPDSTIFLNDFPSGSKIGSETLSARMIAIGTNFGPVIKDDGKNFTQNGITFWRNALYSLAGLAVPTTPVVIEEEEAPVSINIDFGAGSNTTTDPGWNNLFLESVDTQKVSLIDSKGDSTGIVAYFHDAMQGINQGGTLSAAAELNLPSTVSSDNLYVSGADPTGGITFENLDKSLKYSFNIFASRMGVTDNREAKYTFTGQNTVVGTLNSSDNESHIAEVKDVVPDADGKILLAIEKGDNNTNDVGYSYIGALRFTSTVITGINTSKSPVSAIKAYPVPFDNQLTISNLTSQSTISLYTVIGSKIYEAKTNSSQININTSGYNPGIYILSVSDNGVVKGTFKVVKK